MSDKFKKLFVQLFRFGIVGGLAFVIDYLTMLGLVELFGMHYLLASGIAFTVSVIFNYWLSIKWVFQERKEQKKSVELVVFLVLSVLGLLLNALCMYVFTDLLSLDYRISKIFATAIVMVWNFISRKIFLEKK